MELIVDDAEGLRKLENGRVIRVLESDDADQAGAVLGDLLAGEGDVGRGFIDVADGDRDAEAGEFDGDRGGKLMVLRDGKVVGYLSSGNYGHTLGGAVGMGYVPCKGESAADVLGSSYQIEVAGTLVEAEVSLKPMYDPKSERVKV